MDIKKHFTVIKITLAALLIICTIGCVAVAKTPSKSEGIIRFNETLLAEKQIEWEKYNNEVIYYKGLMDNSMALREKAHEEAEAYRGVINAIQGTDIMKPVQVPFSQPLK